MSYGPNNELRCDMEHDCKAPCTHIDDKGFIYCHEHGIDRRESGMRCRKLRPFEIRRLKRGKPVERYAIWRRKLPV